jgi:hypothetical protein
MRTAAPPGDYAEGPERHGGPEASLVEDAVSGITPAYR